METIILASSSPRRQELLNIGGIPFVAAPSNVDESIPKEMEPHVAVLTLANKKLDFFLENTQRGGCNWVLAADTLVRFNGKNIGKPKTREEADAILRQLSGKQHTVYTAMVLYSKSLKQKVESVEVASIRFATLSETDLQWYLETGEWQDVAGGYRLQGKAQFFIEELVGVPSTVIGLPLHKLYKMLAQLNYPINN
ncbi:Maf family protein [Entomospira culicis]|uniref:dTTP/UTP pyrophosphatase n=1 Tax=Entomospira culicis TaxID=2719989 RepID=A0A968GEW7_9SPIO|nr:Maf family protein [Entomospira culicis]NIZ18782.1 septum formation protein Maf [Entomospira culicis]NIZ68997.1 septum formation protein Maf [Entomospira culicis]WDI37588.1 Maf family protein [Entomospira culicis]WDI39216.1 Maf family protein [Entomospira culicis]